MTEVVGEELLSPSEKEFVARFKSFCKKIGGKLIGRVTELTIGNKWFFTCFLPRGEIDTLWVYVHDRSTLVVEAKKGNIREIERLATSEMLKNMGIKDLVLSGHGEGSYDVEKDKFIPIGFLIEEGLLPKSIKINRFLDKLEIYVE